MAETLEGSTSRHSGIHFLPSLSCSFPTFLIHHLPFLSDAQHLSEASLTGGEALLTDRDLSPFPSYWRGRACHPKGWGRKLGSVFSAPGAQPEEEASLLRSPLPHVVCVNVEFLFCFLIRDLPVNATGCRNLKEQVLNAWMFRSC